MIRLSENNNVELDGQIYDKENILNLMRLQLQLFKEEQIIATIEECANIWQKHSWDLSASWLCFPDKDEDILRMIKSCYSFDNFENYAK